MKKKLENLNNERQLGLILSVIFGTILIIIICLLAMKQTTPEDEPPKKKTTEPINNTETIAVLPTMYDTLVTDAAWTPTFQLIWNDLKNEYVHKDIWWEDHPSIVDSLNKEYFKEDMISDAYLYKVHDYKTLELKSRIEKAIKDKFNQDSDILDSLDWSDGALDHGPEAGERRILLYSMLYREFEFLEPLDELKNSIFQDVEDVRYFGIDKESDYKLYDQVEVLYYNKDDDTYGIKLSTKSNDELYFIYKPQGNNFNEIWENTKKNTKDFKGNKSFTKDDSLSIPYLDFDIRRDYTELCGHDFVNATDTEKFNIAQAIQTIKFKLDNKGGKVKSEAVIDVKNEATAFNPDKEIRYFTFNDTFALFIKEKDKEVPYFAARIDDINKYQEEA